MRVFESYDAVRENVPVIIGLIGPTGSGKTGSALELATGFQDVQGGDIGVIDTEAKRAKAYAEAPMFSEPSRNFKFKHLDFKAPFSPTDYQAAVEHFVKQGVKHVIVDSTSHIWEGTGGVLENHEAEVERLMKAWNCTGEKANFPAWNKAKKPLTDFTNYFKQQNINLILNFRAKEKLKMINNKPIPSGWQPIGPDDLIYEMMLACLLLPECDGQPVWNKAEEKGVKALPAHFRKLFSTNPRLSAAVGRELAKWAMGGQMPPKPTPQEPQKSPETAIPAVNQQEVVPSQPETKPTPQNPPQEATPQSGETWVEGLIESVDISTGETNGSKWVLIKAVMNGQTFGTFNKDFTEILETAKTKKQPMRIRWEVNAKGNKTIKEVRFPAVV